MDRRHTANCCKAIKAAILLTAMWLAAGCASNRSEANFKTVTSYLERGGSFYQVHTDNGALAGLTDRYFIKFDEAIDQIKVPEAKRDRLRKKIMISRLLVRLLIFDSCRGYGASSVKRSTGLWSNRIFVGVPQEKKSVLDWILNRQNSDIKEITGSLPAETFYCAGVNVSVSSTLELFRNAGSLGESMLAKLPHGFPVELLSSIEGWCVIAAARRVGWPAIEDCLMVRLPDPEGKIFEFICRTPLVMPADPKDPARRRLALRDINFGLIAPLMVKQQGYLVLYNSLEAEKLYSSTSGAKLGDSEHYKRYSAGLPDSGSAFLYSRQIYGGSGLFSPSVRAGINVDLDHEDSFNVLSRTAEGWLGSGNGDLDIPGEVISRMLFRRLTDLINVRERVKKTVRKRPAAVKKNSGEPKDGSCASELKKIYGELKKYADAHDGFFSGDAGSAEHKALLKDRFLCFSKIRKDGPVLPLLLDVPGRHQGSFCVLYSDGSVKSYELTNPGSCRRIISFLYTIHRWENKIFQHLMNEAQRMDDALAKQGEQYHGR